MKKSTLFISFLTAIVIFIAYQVATSHPAPAREETAPKPAAVVVARRGNLASSITLSAEFRPYVQADIHAEVAGYLKNITVDIGDQVKAGQVIATLDVPNLQQEFNRAQADYRNARLDYNRISEVVAKRPGLLAQADVDKAKATYEMAKANMERAKTFLDYAVITAPFDGIVTKRYVDPGALIQAGTNSNTQALPLVHLAENTLLRLDFPVPEAAVPDIRVGMPVEVTVQATGQVISASIVRTTGRIDDSTRTMETEVDIPNNDLRITPGMYATAVIDLEQKKNVVSLPVQAVSLGDKPNVWLVDAQGNIVERPVSVGLQTPDAVEIVKGIQAGDRCIFGSRNSFSIGMKVTPKPISENPEKGG